VFDVDGVIARYNHNQICSEYLGLKGIEDNDILEYNIGNCLGVTDKDIENMYGQACHKPLNIEEGALETLSKLFMKDHEIFIWTHRFKFQNRSEIEKLLFLAEVPYADLIDKLDFPVDAVFDDSIEKLLEAKPFCSNLYLFSRPWNEHCLNLRSYFNWVWNWNDIDKILTETGVYNENTIK
jgi:hypothetical protein